MKRPRRHSGKLDEDQGRSVKAGLDLDALDSLPSREPMVRKGKGWREGGYFDSRQLARWLRAQVGRRWDEVYSEVSLLKDEEVKDAARREVELNTRLDGDGTVVALCRYIGPRRMADDTSGTLYLHPVTGLLCSTPLRARRGKPVPKPLPYRLIDGAYYLSVAGLWYAAVREASGVFDRIHLYRGDVDTLPQGASRYAIWEGYGTDPRWTLVKGKQLDSRTLKRLGLVNSPLPHLSDHVADQQWRERARRSLGG